MTYATDHMDFAEATKSIVQIVVVRPRIRVEQLREASYKFDKYWMNRRRCAKICCIPVKNDSGGGPGMLENLERRVNALYAKYRVIPRASTS